MQEIMGRSRFVWFLLVLALLVLSFSHGFCGTVSMETADGGDFSVQVEETPGKSRETVEIMDYQLDPGPNTNPKNGIPPPHG